MTCTVLSIFNSSVSLQFCSFLNISMKTCPWETQSNEVIVLLSAEWHWAVRLNYCKNQEFKIWKVESLSLLSPKWRPEKISSVLQLHCRHTAMHQNCHHRHMIFQDNISWICLWIHWIYIRSPFLFSLYSLPILNTILETWILELHATILYNPHSLLSFPHWTTYITHSVASLLCYPIPLHSACVHNTTLNGQAQIPVTWLKTLHLVISQTIPFWCQSYFAVQVTWKDRFVLGWHSTIGSVVAVMLLWEMLINARLRMDIQHSWKYCYLMKNTFWELL